ncbi:PorP/SprF family type IX secretion system membrane protein [Aquimarina brevivitae]|uniref:Type IX secretion system PorP/SprF family membrane protein n=1 Tax=Aquimarina brevivitae TaxID=323412 RepID=A0A4Q7P325_9FLAO|nr:PorP/SprF family type IX secretion system membrane protein [Aquimarina brevivitae]RZS93072.1 type IX secretion system PorP/SprF family membrane protein [Aquimarina brevivitae]
MTRGFQFLQLIIYILVFQQYSTAQQTPSFSDYNYNALLINPAEAGYFPQTDITLTNRGYLNQFEGSARTLGVLMNSSLRSEKLGLGLGVMYDEIGVTTTSFISGSLSYKINLDHNYNRVRWWSYNPSVLSFGITAGVALYNEDLLALGIDNDPNFAANIDTAVPVIGAGIRFNREHIFIGVSAPNLLGDTLSNENNLNLERPWYLNAGYRFFATRFQEVLITPSVLLKYVVGAPLQFDFNTIINYKNKFEVGGGYRTDTSINLLAGFYMFDSWRIVYSYNQTTRNTPINNTHGFVLSYRFNNGFKKS